ncbi:hypothetical protein BV20DRAFT_153469 [Pilatotrama ljubarskyi]|nr:hypothetical protein BV20DRAFT_153469 [Pilatotrama ljubarskyi]
MASIHHRCSDLGERAATASHFLTRLLNFSTAFPRSFRGPASGDRMPAYALAEQRRPMFTHRSVVPHARRCAPALDLTTKSAATKGSRTAGPQPGRTRGPGDNTLALVLQVLNAQCCGERTYTQDVRTREDGSVARRSDVGLSLPVHSRPWTLEDRRSQYGLMQRCRAVVEREPWPRTRLLLQQRPPSRSSARCPVGPTRGRHRAAAAASPFLSSSRTRTALICCMKLNRVRGIRSGISILISTSTSTGTRDVCAPGASRLSSTATARAAHPDRGGSRGQGSLGPGYLGRTGGRQMHREMHD